jgi:5'(3')-deoxyribonucleotidase
VDYDGTIVNSIAAIVGIYNEDFWFYDDYTPIGWWMIETWDFTELKCASKEYIDTYFNQPRFFNTVKFIPHADDVLKKLSEYFQIVVVSSGHKPNLKGKEEWLSNNLPYAEFIGVDIDKYEDKSHLNLSDGIFIDDVARNLETSNANIKICFGDEYPWNKNWDGRRCANWNDVWDMIGNV